MKRNKKKQKRAFVNLRESPFLFQPLFVLVGMTDAIAAEQDGDAPDSCQAHDRIDDARYDGAQPPKMLAMRSNWNRPTIPQFSAPMMTRISASVSMVFSFSFFVM